MTNKTLDDLPPVTIYGKAAAMAHLRVFRVRPTNFTCRVRVTEGAVEAEVLLSASQLRELAADLLRRADAMLQEPGR